MKSISQIAKETGISVRTLQYYDEIGLLKPARLSESGYRMYNESSLGTLQQILTLKELDFSLKEIQELLSSPQSSRISKFRKKKQQFFIERSILDRRIELLTRLEQEETFDHLQEYDLTDYLQALEEFKSNHPSDVLKYWGSMENFDLFIRKIRDSEAQAARRAVQEFGSVEKYTEAMKYNLEHFSELMEEQQAQIPEELKKDDPFVSITSHMDLPVSSNTVQKLVKRAVKRVQETSSSGLFCDAASYCEMIIDLYSGDYIRSLTDTKNGAGSAEYLVRAFQYYLEHMKEEEPDISES